MPLKLTLMLALVSSLTARAETAQPLPTPFPKARYQQMSAKSPFAVASAAVATAAPTPGFASQLYIDGVAHVGKTDFVAIKSRDLDQPKVLFIEVGGTDDGLKVDRVKWADEMGKSTVDVSKDGEKATLEFDEATVKTAAPNMMPGQPVGIRMPIMPGQARPMNFPIPNGQPQFNRAFPQQPPMMQPQPPGNNALTPAMINQQRRRVRGTIQSPP